MFGRFLLIGALCIPAAGQVGEFHGSPNDAKSFVGATSIANKLFPCPDAKWSLVEQTFWRHHTVLKLASCKWPHRPTVAVDEQGFAFLLTNNVLRISTKTPLAHFNAANESESTLVDAGSILGYLNFFVSSQLNWCDGLYFGGDSMAREVKELWRESDAGRLAKQTNDLKAKLLPIGDISLKDAENNHAFKAVVYQWRPDGTPPALQRHDITIHQDGTIQLNSEWIWRDPPTHDSYRDITH